MYFIWRLGTFSLFLHFHYYHEKFIYLPSSLRFNDVEDIYLHKLVWCWFVIIEKIQTVTHCKPESYELYGRTLEIFLQNELCLLFSVEDLYIGIFEQPLPMNSGTKDWEQWNARREEKPGAFKQTVHRNVNIETGLRTSDRKFFAMVRSKFKEFSSISLIYSWNICKFIWDTKFFWESSVKG